MLLLLVLLLQGNPPLPPGAVLQVIAATITQKQTMLPDKKTIYQYYQTIRTFGAESQCMLLLLLLLPQGNLAVPPRAVLQVTAADITQKQTLLPDNKTIYQYHRTVRTFDTKFECMHSAAA